MKMQIKYNYQIFLQRIRNHSILGNKTQLTSQINNRANMTVTQSKSKMSQPELLVHFINRMNQKYLGKNEVKDSQQLSNRQLASEQVGNYNLNFRRKSARLENQTNKSMNLMKKNAKIQTVRKDNEILDIQKNIQDKLQNNESGNIINSSFNTIISLTIDEQENKIEPVQNEQDNYVKTERLISKQSKIQCLHIILAQNMNQRRTSKTREEFRLPKFIERKMY